MRVLNQESEEGLSELLVGHTVTKVSDDTLTLDDGTVLRFEGTGECCAYYDLEQLNGVDNVITKVELLNDPAGDDDPDGSGVYAIFVYADNVKVNLATFKGTDGNGYYGTGYTIHVKETHE
jgi:hypothetical protein